MEPNDKQLLCHVEASYDSFKPKLDNLKISLEAFREAYDSYREVRDFYGSQKWFELREEPTDGIKSGVLSEDQIYFLITEHKDLLVDLLALSTEMSKNL
ncbi:DUF4298 domain-containing protein [Streptococcus phocae subsp. salmonis]|uniref:DUF4298 domain-containing protein n=1 Tax=Streptococcus phocae TaxID=119224 RepID=UPI000531CA6E|nr:DUF4298 domain-containing protein [Streptococcus phocae]KGR72376.1 hypothetical protein NX86_06560 [Streptococcus phocae subsp. salmonis]